MSSDSESGNNDAKPKKSISKAKSNLLFNFIRRLRYISVRNINLKQFHGNGSEDCKDKHCSFELPDTFIEILARHDDESSKEKGKGIDKEKSNQEEEEVVQPSNYDVLYRSHTAYHTFNPTWLVMELEDLDEIYGDEFIIRIYKDQKNSASASASPSFLNLDWDYQNSTNFFLQKEKELVDHTAAGPRRTTIVQQRHQYQQQQQQEKGQHTKPVKEVVKNQLII